MTVSNYNQIIEKIRAQADSTVELGNSFERLIKNFLLTSPTYRFADVWLWSEFPYRESIDLGIDIVALDRHGEFWAVQCKFYQPDIRIDKPAVDSFLGASSRSFNVDNRQKNFSQRLWIATTDLWNDNAWTQSENQTPPLSRLGPHELEDAPVDWAKLEQGIVGNAARLKNNLRNHQQAAVNAAVKHYKHHDRGKLIMACGTGKTFTSLKIAERLVAPRGTVLYLTPSISLLNQTLIEWTAQAAVDINAVCVCSDETAAKSDDVPIDRPVLPSTTNHEEIKRRLRADAFNVIFSTYQSLDKVSDANLDFDLIICDEAHRTAGFAELGADAPLFKSVHDNNFVRAKRRLYMTATPKLFTVAAKKSAADKDLTLWSMDDEAVFGPEFYVLKFSDALDQKLLTDYRVLVFTVREQDVPARLLENFNTGDAAKIFGAVNALHKHLSPESEYILRDDPNPMRSAVAYCSSIKLSKNIAAIFNSVEPEFVSADHVDGSMRSDRRKEKLAALKSVVENRCRILTNARCLSEGIDVPALDAVLFLSPRKSQVDIIQAVGRVMRKAEGKTYGYVILPIVIPRGADPVDELNHNKDFDTVWQVLNALRAHDDKFYIEVNKLTLNNNANAVGQNRKLIIDTTPEYQMTLDFGDFKHAIVARIVEKVGDRQYWATWGRDVAVIAERHKARILQLIAVEGKHKTAFDQFLDGLRHNINPAVTVDDAVDMLAQHLITRPVFEALFENYNFMERNAVSRSMQNILRLLDDRAADKENDKLQKIYDGVRERCSYIADPRDRQKVIIELYDKFFKVALHKTVEKLGIVYTPVEVVDFILKSVDAVLRAEFNRSLSDTGVHILDPFTGTGTFITRLIELGLIDDANLTRKYSSEIHANEIVLLAYYIAAINIENAFHARAAGDRYLPFDGICLTDTFALKRDAAIGNLFNFMMENSMQIAEQNRAEIQVIVGNPPYSVGQKSANDNAQNQKYPALEQRITDTYVKHTKAINKNSLYDSYIKAFRWASDRIDKSGGVIGFVTNGGWLDTAAMDGMRKCFADEFSSIYVFNLRGNARTQGELRRKESGNVFGEGTRTPVTITILVKNPAVEGRATIRYVDVGDYLNRQEKLGRIVALDNCRSESFMSEARVIEPNEKHDWINQRGDLFDAFLSIEPSKKFDDSARSFFTTYSKGLETGRDAWCYNFSRDAVERNMNRTINFYNQCLGAEPIYDSTKISWTRATKQKFEHGTKIIFEGDRIVESIYRPFCRQFLYSHENFINYPSQMPKIFPKGCEDNRMICLPGIGERRKFSVLMVDRITEVQFLFTVQCFPLHWYSAPAQQSLLDDNLLVHDGITDYILSRARRLYGSSVSKEDIFYYVYGFLHLPSYRERFANELRKSLPKLFLVPRASDFWSLSKAGRELAELHLNYETQPAPPCVVVEGAESGDYRVTRMKLSKDRTTLRYNGSIVLKGIPLRSYEYVVNGRSPLEWVIDRYQVKTDKASGLTNDPNDWCAEHGDPKYILRLILSVLTVSVRTVEIVDGLPSIEFDGLDG